MNGPVDYLGQRGCVEPIRRLLARRVARQGRVGRREDRHSNEDYPGP
jgi:hypothetical protein